MSLTSIGRAVRPAALRQWFLVCLLAASLPLAEFPGAAVADEPTSNVVLRPVAPEAAAPAGLPATEAAFTKAVPESLDDLLAIENTLTGLVDTLNACTVNIRIGGSEGSGAIVSEDGYVLTAAHVVGDPGNRVDVILPDGRRVKGRTLGVDKRADAALVKLIDEEKYPFALMARPADPQVGQWCIATGHPGGFQKQRPAVVRLGRVVSLRRDLVQTDCTLVGGDSGGPLFNMEGEVIGIHSRIGARTDYNFHVPVSYYVDNWERLLEPTSLDSSLPPDLARPVIGIQGEDHPEGCLIVGVTPAYPAHRAGLEVGDVIVRFDDRRVGSFAALSDLIHQRRPGDRVRVTVLRGEERIDTILTIDQRP